MLISIFRNPRAYLSPCPWVDAHSSLRRETQEGCLPLYILKVRKRRGWSCSLSREKPMGSAVDSPPPFEGGMVPADPRDEGCGRQRPPPLLLPLVKMTSCFPRRPWGALTRSPLVDGPLTEALGWRGGPWLVSHSRSVSVYCGLSVLNANKKKVICCIKHLERKSLLAFIQKENLDYINRYRNKYQLCAEPQGTDSLVHTGII